MCAKKLDALPYRRLRMMANGIWDEAKKEFYPFRVKGSTTPANVKLSAKRGICYFVYTTAVSLYTHDDAVVRRGYFSGTINGVAQNFFGVFLPVTTGSFACGVNAMPMNILCDENTQVDVISNADGGNYVIVYAEIPADPAGGPVMIE